MQYADAWSRRAEPWLWVLSSKLQQRPPIGGSGGDQWQEKLSAPLKLPGDKRDQVITYARVLLLALPLLASHMILGNSLAIKFDF